MAGYWCADVSVNIPASLRLRMTRERDAEYRALESRGRADEETSVLLAVEANVAAVRRYRFAADASASEPANRTATRYSTDFVDRADVRRIKVVV